MESKTEVGIFKDACFSGKWRCGADLLACRAAGVGAVVSFSLSSSPCGQGLGLRSPEADLRQGFLRELLGKQWAGWDSRWDSTEHSFSDSKGSSQVSIRPQLP